MNIIIPMAGKGQRFKDAGYTEEKPFIDVNGKPMFQVALENLGMTGWDTHWVFIVNPDQTTRVHKVLQNLGTYFNCHTIFIQGGADGAADACLRASDIAAMNPDEPLVVANCDQIIDWSSEDFLEYCKDTKCDGCVATFKANSPNHSYAATGTPPFNNLVDVIAEKVVISDNALCGVHYWRTTELAMSSFASALRYAPHYNGDYYIAPTYNELIKLNYRILIYPTDGMTILGTPDKLEEYLENSSTN